MDYFLLHGGGNADRQSGGVHRWLAGAIRELGMLVAETSGHDAFLEQIGAVHPEVVFVRFASSPARIDVPEHDQKLGEGTDAIGEATQQGFSMTMCLPARAALMAHSARSA
ncbi:pilus assembly protein, partial [Ralstonia pseudosolanacearum]